MSQRLEALARANEVRFARAALRGQVRRGELTVADVLRDVPWMAAGMPIAELLSCQHRWGPTRTGRLLRAVTISESRPLEALTVRQRNLIVSLLAGDQHAIREAQTNRAVERWLLEQYGGQAA